MKQYMHFFCGLVFVQVTACGQISTVDQDSTAIKLAEEPGTMLDNEVLAVDSSIIDSSGIGLTFYSQEKYNTHLNGVETLKRSCKKLLEQFTERGDSIYAIIGAQFEAYLMNRIVPHWYGTPWEFSGYTNVPNEGAIACGYFVSTTLKHMGMPLNRYKLAQQGAYDEGRSLAIDQSQMQIIPFDTIFDYASQMKNGLYFLGLDYHVGYLWIHEKEPYFLHSNYVENKVMLEKARYSPAFLSSTNYYIVPVTHNKPLMKSWLNNTPIQIYLTP